MSGRSKVSVSPAVLRWARMSSGVDEQEAADHVGRPVAVLQSWEREGAQERPSLAALESLADYFGRPLSVFLLDTPPTEPPIPVDFRAPAGEEANRVTRPVRLAVRNARSIQRLLGELDSGTWRLSRFDSDTVESAAVEARKQIGIDYTRQSAWGSAPGALQEWRRAVEALGAAVLQADVPSHDISAFSMAGQPPVIVLNEHDPAVRRIFSLFHEFGHLRLGAGALCRPLEGPTPASSETERLCDRFANAFLVPREPLLDGLRDLGRNAESISDSELKTMSDRFRVSRQVVWFRLRDLGYLSSSVFHQRWPADKPPPPRLTKPPRIARWQKAAWRFSPSVIGRLLQAEERGDIPTTDVLRYLDVPIEAIPRLADVAARRR